MADPVLEEQKKLVLPFLQRAQEVQDADPKVAYYVRLYAVDQALKLERRHKEITALLTAALNSLEKAKASLTLDPEQDRYHCEAFALRIFSNADKADRAGRAGASTARAFLASTYFLEILNQFGPLDNDLASKQKYAAWRAAEISKAIREGRPPVPPSTPEQQAQMQAQDGSLLGPSSASSAPDSLGLGSMAGIQGLPSASAPPPPVRTGSISAAAPSHQPSSAVLHQFDPDQQQPGSSGSGGSFRAPPQAPPQPQPQGTASYLGQRYRPGSPVLYCESPELGSGATLTRSIVAQVLPPDPANEGAGCRYRIALQHMFIEATDSQLAPGATEGTHILYRPRPSSPQVAAEVVLVNDGMGWPPTFLVKLPDGSEASADKHQLSFVSDQEVSSGTTNSYGSAVPATVAAAAAGVGALDAASAPPPPPLLGFDGHLPTAPPPPPSSSNSGTAGTAGGQYPSISGRYGSPSSTNVQPQPQQPANPPGHPPPRTSSAAAHQQQPRYPPGSAQSHPPPVAAGHLNGGFTMAAGGSSSMGGVLSGGPLPTLPTGFKPSIQAISEAQKACRTAISALNFEDAASAVRCLTQAIHLLVGHQQPGHM